MAANNYFGFGGPQYGAQATAYPTAAPQGYVQPAAGQATAYATAAAPRTAQAYESYPTTAAAAATQQYAYPTRQPVSAVKVSALQTAIAPVTPQTYPENYYARPTTTYDAAKTYYQPTAQSSFAASNTQYQTAKPAYSTTATSYQTQAQRAAPKANYVYQSASATTHPVSSFSSTASYANPTSTASGYTGVAGAVYSAATNFYQQSQQNTATITPKPASAAWKPRQPFHKTAQKPKPQPKQMQLHYCDVCKISCAGPQTYREHLDGQKHKKKEAGMKVNPATVPRGGQNQLRCELCDVTCTGTDAYAAHIRGAKHLKVMKLHTILGKPIPSTEPVLITTTSGNKSGSSSTGTPSTTSAPKLAVKTITPTTGNTLSVTQPAKKIVSTPKITFVGGNTLKSTAQVNVKVETKPEPVKIQSDPEPMATDNSKTIEEKKVSLAALQEHETQPVGHEYIEEVKNEGGKVVSFQCKLCECKFNDPNAKEMHLKGRRHRLQYKKKVDPNLQVEVKPSIRARKIQEDRHRRQMQKEEFWKRRDQEERWKEEMREMEAMQWRGGGGPMGHGFGRPMMPMRRPDSSDDRHVMAKHASIYPNESELQTVQCIVSACEKALKQVSDVIADEDTPKDEEEPAPVVVEPKTPVKKIKKEDEKKEGEKKEDAANAPPRALKGVMRVGVLAKGLLLHGDLHVHLVVLCSEKPTRTLLERVYNNLPKLLDAATEEKYSVRLSVEEAAIVVGNEKEPLTSCTITLTSPIMREENLVAGESTDKMKDPPDVLDRQKCLNALAALRHAKWFQARANGLQSCVVVIRILRDLCQRVPTWAPLNEWAMELLVEKCVASGGPSMSPGDALRRVFECIASGILLPGGPGLYDPCEKEATDAAQSLTNQEREDISASAQHALRLIAFRQIHKVLGMDPLPTPRFARNRFNSRKRRRTNSAGDGSEEGKKDKKDEDTVMDTAAE